MTQTCPTCQGTGSIIDNPCKACGGSGLEKRKRKIQITIPPGIDDGKRINIPKQGDAGRNGGPAGDLFIFMHVQSHPQFERSGEDLYCAVPISIMQAALGAELTVTVLDGKKIKIRIPAGTQNGKLLRVRDEGVPIGNTGRKGDLYIKVIVKVPSKLSSKSKQLLEEVSRIEGENESPEPLHLSELNN